MDAVVGRVLAEGYEVVALDTGLSAAGPSSFSIPALRCRMLVGQCTVENNLAVQAAVLARASAFVGNFGGIAHLAASCGVPTLALTHDLPARYPQYRSALERIARSNAAPLQVSLLDRSAPGVTRAWLERVMGTACSDVIPDSGDRAGGVRS